VPLRKNLTKKLSEMSDAYQKPIKKAIDLSVAFDQAWKGAIVSTTQL
jgi:hypothetical protein